MTKATDSVLPLTREQNFGKFYDHIYSKIKNAFARRQTTSGSLKCSFYKKKFRMAEVVGLVIQMASHWIVPTLKWQKKSKIPEKLLKILVPVVELDSLRPQDVVLALKI